LFYQGTARPTDDIRRKDNPVHNQQQMGMVPGAGGASGAPNYQLRSTRGQSSKPREGGNMTRKKDLTTNYFNPLSAKFIVKVTLCQRSPRIQASPSH